MYFWTALFEAINMIITLEKEVIAVVMISLSMAGASTLIASTIGIAIGIFISKVKFKGRFFLNSILNTLLGLPTVVVGLFVYSLISRRGPFGEYQLLFTTKGIVVGQVILIMPIVVVLVRNAIVQMDDRLINTAISLGATRGQRLLLLIAEARYGIIGAVVTAFGRVIGEIGVSMMLGGNIKGVTRTITTAIALEINKGEFSFALALGIILLLISLVINVIVHYLQTGEQK